MKTEADTQVQAGNAGGMDTAKLVIAALLVVGGLVGYYVFSEHSVLLRVLALVACIIVAIVIGLQTAQGRSVWGFFHEAHNEVRRVVWPTRGETMQTTGLVIVMVIVSALIMWALDLVLGWGIQFVVGTGS